MPGSVRFRKFGNKIHISWLVGRSNVASFSVDSFNGVIIDKKKAGVPSARDIHTLCQILQRYNERDTVNKILNRYN